MPEGKGCIAAGLTRSGIEPDAVPALLETARRLLGGIGASASLPNSICSSSCMQIASLDHTDCHNTCVNVWRHSLCCSNASRQNSHSYSPAQPGTVTAHQIVLLQKAHFMRDRGLFVCSIASGYPCPRTAAQLTAGCHRLTDRHGTTRAGTTAQCLKVLQGVDLRGNTRCSPDWTMQS